MTMSRQSQVSLEATPYYHCITRCVRRAFLCGDDRYTGENFDHRKQWIVDRLGFLARIYCIDVCAYAVMSNHLHLVLRIDAERAAALSDEQVVARYSKLFTGARAKLAAASPTQRDALIDTWRSRLMDLSWMMRSLNEWVARRANREDGCTGRFWEGRFKSQALLDECGLLTCMAYVDLNPVRAGLARSLEQSEFTSIHARLQAANAAGSKSGAAVSMPCRLAPMADDRRTRRRDRMPMQLLAYIELLEWTGRAIKAGRTGRIQGAPPALLSQLGLGADGWTRAMQAHHIATSSALGRIDALDAEAARRGKAWVTGKCVSRMLGAA